MSSMQLLLIGGICALLAGCADVPASEPARVDSLPSTKNLLKLPRKPGDRVAVSIYEFRSSVPEITARGTTDMFKTALVESGQFRVVERARLNEGVVREKQLNGAGLTTGKGAATQLTAARFIFEGTITEANTSETQRSTGLSIGGMDLGHATNRDVIGIDVRIVDAESGDILDVVTVRKSIRGDTNSVTGVGNLIGTALSTKGRDTTYVPDVHMQQQRKESLDVALRSAIDQAVIALAARFPQ